MNNKGFAHLFVTLLAVSVLILSILTFTFRENISGTYNNVLAYADQRLSAVTGKYMTSVPGLDVTAPYEIFLELDKDGSNFDQESLRFNVFITGEGAQKIADYYNNYSHRSAGLNIYSVYPNIGSANEFNPQVRVVPIKFQKVDYFGKTAYRGSFYYYYTDTRIEFSYFKEIKNLSSSYSFRREGSNSLTRTIEDQNTVNFIRSDSKGIALGFLLKGEGAYKTAKNIRESKIEVVLSNGQKTYVSLPLVPSAFQKGYYAQFSSVGEITTVNLPYAFPFNLTYNSFPGAINFKDWEVSSDGKTISRKVSIPSTELITTKVTLSNCPNFNFYNKTNCIVIFDFTGTRAQIIQLIAKIKENKVYVDRLKDPNLTPIGDTYTDPNIKFKITLAGPTRLIGNFNLPSDTRKIDFFSTGLKFNFISVPGFFSNQSTFYLLKVK